MSVKKTLENFPEVSFIENMSLEDIKSYYLTAMQERYRELTGKELILQEADPVRLIAYANCFYNIQNLLFQLQNIINHRFGCMAVIVVIHLCHKGFSFFFVFLP